MPVNSWLGPIGPPSKNGPMYLQARGEGYDAFKGQVEGKLFAQFAKYFPDLADLVVFRQLSTPLATTAITGHDQGAFYGLDVTPERALSGAFQTKTPISGLYLSGQDVGAKHPDTIPHRRDDRGIDACKKMLQAQDVCASHNSD